MGNHSDHRVNSHLVRHGERAESVAAGAFLGAVPLPTPFLVVTSFFTGAVPFLAAGFLVDSSASEVSSAAVALPFLVAVAFLTGGFFGDSSTVWPRGAVV